MGDVERFKNEDGLVAVLISPACGAGWSTWPNENFRDFALFDRGLVEMAMRGAEIGEVAAYIEGKLNGEYFDLGGWGDIEVVWVEPGTAFTVEECDGNESLRFISDLTIIA